MADQFMTSGNALPDHGPHRCHKCGKEHRGPFPPGWAAPFNYGVLCDGCFPGYDHIRTAHIDQMHKAIKEYMNSVKPNDQTTGPEDPVH